MAWIIGCMGPGALGRHMSLACRRKLLPCKKRNCVFLVKIVYKMRYETQIPARNAMDALERAFSESCALVGIREQIWTAWDIAQVDPSARPQVQARARLLLASSSEHHLQVEMWMLPSKIYCSNVATRLDYICGVPAQEAATRNTLHRMGTHNTIINYVDAIHEDTIDCEDDEWGSGELGNLRHLRDEIGVVFAEFEEEMCGYFSDDFLMSLNAWDFELGA